MPMWFRRYPLTLCAIALVWYLCLFRPPSTPADGIAGLDKAVHVLMYFGLCGLLHYEYARAHTVYNKKWLLGWGVAAPIAMSGVIELVQEYATTYRGGDWADFAANTLGVVLAAGVGNSLLRRFRKK